jgi:hypothetical protein
MSLRLYRECDGAVPVGRHVNLTHNPQTGAGLQPYALLLVTTLGNLLRTAPQSLARIALHLHTLPLLGSNQSHALPERSRPSQPLPTLTFCAIFTNPVENSPIYPAISLATKHLQKSRE